MDIVEILRRMQAGERVRAVFEGRSFWVSRLFFVPSLPYTGMGAGWYVCGSPFSTYLSVDECTFHKDPDPLNERRSSMQNPKMDFILRHESMCLLNELLKPGSMIYVVYKRVSTQTGNTVMEVYAKGPEPSLVCITHDVSRVLPSYTIQKSGGILSKGFGHNHAALLAHRLSDFLQLPNSAVNSQIL